MPANILWPAFRCGLLVENTAVYSLHLPIKEGTRFAKERFSFYVLSIHA